MRQHPNHAIGGRRWNHAVRTGVTLLELILALSISGIVLLGLFSVMYAQTNLYSTGRENVAQSQLARAILQRIANDLRSCVQTEITDFGDVELLDLESLGGDLIGGELGELGLDPSMLPDELENELGGGDSGAEGLPTEATPLAASVIPPERPGLYGSQFEIQFDISRLPRLDEYDPTINLTGAALIPSDVKTIAYYLNDPSLGGAAGVGLTDPGNLGGNGNSASLLMEQNNDADSSFNGPQGLLRRELDRAVTSWALNSGDPTQLAVGEAMLAPEVVGLQFAYFDGEAWQLEWDSEAIGRLPLAIEIIIALEPNERVRSSTGATALPPTNFVFPTPPGSRFYRLVVHLPLADHPPAEEGSDDLTEDDIF